MHDPAGINTAEIFTTLGPQRRLYSGVRSEYTWEDVLLAIQGVDSAHIAFVRYVYLGDESSRHEFFAGFMRQVMRSVPVITWATNQRKIKNRNYDKDIERLVLLAMKEWKLGKAARTTQAARAENMGVARNTWKKRYDWVYMRFISQIPAQWEDEILRIAALRLR